MKFKFEDRGDDFFVNNAYLSTNECLKTIRKLVTEIKPKRAFSVASGGEVPLTVMLPNAKEQVVAVDICYIALTWTCLKALILEHLGPKKMLKLFDDRNNWKDFEAAFLELRNEFPPVLRGRISQGHRPISGVTQYNPYGAIFNYWKRESDVGGINEKLLAKARERLELLTLVHGCITSLNGNSADIYYTSNAMSYCSTRSGHPVTLDELAQALRPGGWILSTDDPSSNRIGKNREKWKLKPLTKSQSTAGWNYYMSQWKGK